MSSRERSRSPLSWSAEPIMSTSLTKKKHSASSRSRRASATSGPLIVELQRSSFKKTGILDKITHRYDLRDIASTLRINLLTTNSNDACIKILKHVIGSEYEVKTGSIPGSDKLCPLYSSSREYADAVVCSRNKLFTVEVHSGSGSADFEFTITKAILGAINCIRLLRFRNDQITSFKSFVFPNLREKTSVVLVRVEFDDFRFGFQLTPIDLNDISNIVEEVFSVDHQLPDEGKISNLLVVKLNRQELTLFQDSSPLVPRQLPSQGALVVDNGSYIFKKLAHHAPNLMYISCLNHVERCITLELSSISSTVMKYKKVKYDPMNFSEISRCSFHYMQDLKRAIDSLHNVQLAHCDIRSNNVCISADFDLILIDMDRMHLLSDKQVSRTYGISCMYDIPDDVLSWNCANYDYLQMGFLLIYAIFAPECSYHSMKFEDFSEECQSDAFLKDLVLKGKYSEEYIETSKVFLGQETVRDVILSR